MNNNNASFEVFYVLTVEMVIEGLVAEYGPEFRTAILGVDMDNKKVLTHADGTYAVNDFFFNLRGLQIVITIADMPTFEF